MGEDGQRQQREWKCGGRAVDGGIEATDESFDVAAAMAGEPTQQRNYSPRGRVAAQLLGRHARLRMHDPVVFARSVHPGGGLPAPSTSSICLLVLYLCLCFWLLHCLVSCASFFGVLFNAHILNHFQRKSKPSSVRNLVQVCKTDECCLSGSLISPVRITARLSYFFYATLLAVQIAPSFSSLHHISSFALRERILFAKHFDQYVGV